MINDLLANQPLLDYDALPPKIKSILDSDKGNLVSRIYQNYDSFINYKDALGNNLLHYAYASSNLDVVILLTAIYNFRNSVNNAGKLPIALYDVDVATRKEKIRELLAISSSPDIYKKFINTLLLLESDDIKKTLLAKFIRESTILNREFGAYEFGAYFSELLKNDSDNKFKKCLLDILPSSELFVIYQKISGSIIATPKEFSLEVLKKIFNQDDNTIKQILLPLSLAFDDKDHLDFICGYIITNPSSSKNLVQDEDYEDSQNLAESFIKSCLSYEQKSSLVKIILTDENFDISTKNKFFSAALNNQKFLESFIDEDSVQKLLLTWNFDNLDEDNLFLAFKNISLADNEGKSKLLLSKIFKRILTSTNIELKIKIEALISILTKGKKIQINIIHEYLMDNKLGSIEGFNSTNIIGELIMNSRFNYQEKSSLIKKFLSQKNLDDPSLDDEFKKNIFISIFENEEFASGFLKENFYYFAIYAKYLPKEYQQKISITGNTIDAETQTNLNHNYSTKRPQASKFQSNTLENRGIETKITTQNQKTQTSDDLKEVMKDSIQEDSGDRSAEIDEASKLKAGPSPRPKKTTKTITKELSSDDYEKLSQLLSGSVLDTGRMVRSYNPDLETIVYELKQFNVNFFANNPYGNEGLASDCTGLADRFHSMLEELASKIYYKDTSFNKGKLKTYLYAILCISSGESDSIESFFNYHDHLIKEERKEEVFFGVGHGSWIKTPTHYSKLKTIINKMDELTSTPGREIFTEKNLEAWLKCQIQDRRIENFRFLDNKEFIIKLIKSFDIRDTDPKAEELDATRIDLQDFLKPNAIFLENLVKIANQGDLENNKFANYLFDFLIAKISPSTTEVDRHIDLVNIDKLDKIAELKENFNEKITKFIEQINSNIKPDFLDDPHHKLIFELILEIPTDLQDFLKSKLDQDPEFQKVEIRASAVSRKISNFIKSLESQNPNDQRKSIVEFRDTCFKQSQKYSKRARELRELKSRAKTSSSASR